MVTLYLGSCQRYSVPDPIMSLERVIGFGGSHIVVTITLITDNTGHIVLFHTVH